MGHASADEFETECRAQIQKALAAGLKPSHLDSHGGVCFLPQYLKRYIKLGVEYRIPVLLFGGHLQHIGREVGDRHSELQLVAAQVCQAGLPIIDDLVTNPTHGGIYEERKAGLIKLLREMKSGVTQVIVHYTDAGEHFSHISASGEKRRAEMRLMLDPEVRKVLGDEGIECTTWRELARRRQAAGAAESH